MRHRQLIFALGVATSMSAANACGSRARDAAPINHTRLQIQCERRSTALQCQALASEDGTTAGRRDVTNVVRWASSDADAVSVRSGRVSANNGSGATVTATLTDAHDAPSASVMVAADAHGETRQAYALEGEVRGFPMAEGIAGVRVILIDESGIVLSATTTSSGTTAGQFRFVPVPAGMYQLRAVCDGYRSTEETIVVPDDAPRTLTLLPQPKNQL
jgi:carboxypeptidase family protein